MRFAKMRMRLACFTLISALTAALAADSGLAQQARVPSVQKPYRPVAVKLPSAFADPSLAAFRSELAAVARGRIYAELARLVAAQGFFWDRDFNGTFDPRKPGVDNLAAAVRLEHRDGVGWDALADFAAEPSAGELPARPGIFCGPARPDYDGPEFDRLMDATRSNAADWVYPRADAEPVLTAAQPKAALVERLGLHLVRVLGYATKDDAPDAIRTAWVRVATPAGKAGFVGPGALMSLTGARLCYGKDEVNRWYIVGFVGEGG